MTSTTAAVEKFLFEEADILDNWSWTSGKH
jgi:3-phenylpropionate/cinnamic acid dioxygenase small subunit